MIKYRVQSNIIKSIFTLLLISLLINGCQQVSNNKSTSNSSENEGLTIHRFEQDLFNTNPNDIDSTLSRLKNKYGEFYPVYFIKIMNFGNTSSSGFNLMVKDFIQNKDFKTLVKDCDSIYNKEKIRELSENINTVFEKYKKIYPNDTLPRVCTFVSGFSNGIVTTDGYIGIGLDLFLGENYKFYPSLELPDYLVRRYTPEHLMPTFVKGMANYKYPFETEKPQLIDILINEGKLLYFMDQLLPDVEDSLKIGYTSDQLNWCKNNEANIYQLLIQEGLYNTNYLKYRKYTDEAPFTVSLNNESAPRIAWFCGWQIVKKFMEENSNYSLDDLMNEKDSQKILTLSKYKP